MEGWGWTSINIWKDCWILIPLTFKVQSPVRILNSDAKVSELIDRDLSWWNISLVHEIFTKEEANLICGIQFAMGVKVIDWFGWVPRMVYSLSKVPIIWQKLIVT